MASGRSKVLQLYKQMMREGQKFSDYNFRHYAVRRVRDRFKDAKSESDPQEIELLIKKGEENLEMMKRQTLIGKLYKHPVLVIEGKTSV